MYGRGRIPKKKKKLPRIIENLKKKKESCVCGLIFVKNKHKFRLGLLI